MKCYHSPTQKSSSLKIIELSNAKLPPFTERAADVVHSNPFKDLNVPILCQKFNPPYPIAQTPDIGYNAHKEQPLCLNTQLAQFPKKQ